MLRSRLVPVAAIGASSLAVGPGAVTATTEPPPAAADGIRLHDNLERVTVSVPDDWTDAHLAPQIGDDGQFRPYLRAAPDWEAAQAGWTIPQVVITTHPAAVEPEWLLGSTPQPGCAEADIEPYDNDRFAGLQQWWTGCAGTTYQFVHVAARPAADASVTILVRIGVPDPEDPAVTLILESLDVVPDAVVIPPGAEPDSLDVSGTVEDSPIAGIADVPTDAVTITDDTGQLTLAVPPEWTNWRTHPARNDDHSPRPLVWASTDEVEFFGWEAPGVRVMVLPPIEPSVLLANYDWARSRCVDGGIFDYDDGRFTGLLHAWLDCDRTPLELVLLALTAADGSVTVLVEARLPDAGDPELATVLASLTVEPGAEAVAEAGADLSEEDVTGEDVTAADTTEVATTVAD